MKKHIPPLWLFVLTVALFGNAGWAAEETSAYWPSHGWRTASPESQGMDVDVLAKMVDTIWEKEIGINGVLVIRNGYIVLEANGYAYDSDDKRNTYSCTKSIISALVGIAIDKGYIKDLRRPVLDFFPNRDAKHLNADKKAMTLENLLTMTAGLECRDSYLYRWRDLNRMTHYRDWVQFMIDLPMAEAPGTRFEYCNGASFLLSAILQEQTGMTALSFAEKHLFEPLRISDVRWQSNPQGITIGWGRIDMRPRDMAKIGHLYLNNGIWDRKRIISSQWIKRSTRKHIAATLLPGYGYQWWISGGGMYAAVGHEGQFIMVAPEKNIVAVFTSSLTPKDFYTPLGLWAAYIMPAIQSPTPLPGNPDGEKALRSKIALWQTTSPMDREKLRKKSEKPAQGLKLETYVNHELGFSAAYDAELLVMDRQLVPPLVFRRSGLRGFPVFAVLVDDIPQKMALENTGDYLMGFYKRMLQVTDAGIKKQERIQLPDGTDANYVEINWRYHTLELLTVGVFAVQNNIIIGALAGSAKETPVEYLAGMAKSLRFKN